MDGIQKTILRGEFYAQEMDDVQARMCLYGQGVHPLQDIWVAISEEHKFFYGAWAARWVLIVTNKKGDVEEAWQWPYWTNREEYLLAQTASLGAFKHLSSQDSALLWAIGEEDITPFLPETEKTP